MYWRTTEPKIFPKKGGYRAKNNQDTNGRCSEISSNLNSLEKLEVVVKRFLESSF